MLGLHKELIFLKYPKVTCMMDILIEYTENVESSRCDNSCKNEK